MVMVILESFVVVANEDSGQKKELYFDFVDDNVIDDVIVNVDELRDEMRCLSFDLLKIPK